MDERFAAAVGSLHSKFEALKACPHLNFGQLPINMPVSGVYLFSEGDRHHYVGRSNRLRKRYFLHCRPGSKHNQASFAFKLTRETVGSLTASYHAGPQSRVGLAKTPNFMVAFAEAKARIREMDYRFVEETDQTRQALLEMYCALALQTPYNDFDTH